jgi:hypothetical protein
MLRTKEMLTFHDESKTIGCMWRQVSFWSVVLFLLWGGFINKAIVYSPRGLSAGCKMYEQQNKQTVDGWERFPESLAITTKSITSHTHPRFPSSAFQMHSHIHMFSAPSSYLIVLVGCSIMGGGRYTSRLISESLCVKSC